MNLLEKSQFHPSLFSILTMIQTLSKNSTCFIYILTPGLFWSKFWILFILFVNRVDFQLTGKGAS